MEQIVSGQEPKEEKIGVTMGYDEENGVFILVFRAEEKAIFQVKMTPENFEQFAAGMIGAVKDYNLYTAQQYLESKNVSDQNPELADQPFENEPEQSEGN